MKSDTTTEDHKMLYKVHTRSEQVLPNKNRKKERKNKTKKGVARWPECLKSTRTSALCPKSQSLAILICNKCLRPWLFSLTPSLFCPPWSTGIAHRHFPSWSLTPICWWLKWDWQLHRVADVKKESRLHCHLGCVSIEPKSAGLTRAHKTCWEWITVIFV